MHIIYSNHIESDLFHVTVSWPSKTILLWDSIAIYENALVKVLLLEEMFAPDGLPSL